MVGARQYSIWSLRRPRIVDQQIGELIRLSRAKTVMVFALHGMRPALGFAGFLGPLLQEFGLSKPAKWRSQTSTERFASLFAATKRHAPAPLRKFYYKITPASTTYKLARPTMLPAFDWKNTRAFCLPTEQHGWIRLNVTGRDKYGIVALNDYEKTCSELEQKLQSLSSEHDELLVRNVIRTAPTSKEALVNPLPDLVVHWRDAALAPSLKIKGSRVGAQLVSEKFTGQHTAEAFCIYRGDLDWGSDNVVDAKDLGKMIAASVSQ